MTTATSDSARPPLTTNDTFDAPRLVGRFSGDGTAELRPSSRPGHADNGANSIPSTPRSTAISEDDSSSLEDYDDMKIDPDTIVDGSKGGILENPFSKSEQDITKMSPKKGGHIRRKSETHGRSISPVTRRRSIQIRLEKTGQKGQYVLTADDPEIQEILRRGMEREEASNDPKRVRSIRDYVFTRQFTTFDRQNPASSESPFHGFFTLFWLSMVLMFVRVSMNNWRDYGSVFGRNEVFKLMFGRDVFVLALTDACMCLSTSFGFFLQKAVLKGYISWAKSGYIIQNIWQSCFLGAVVGWMLYRDWPWTHTIFIILHTMVFLMKQHSYSFYNGYLSGVYKRRNMLRDKLRQLKDIIPTESPVISPDAMLAPSSAIDFSPFVQEKDKNRRPSMALRTASTLDHEQSDVAKVASAMESGEGLNLSQVQAFERIIQGEIDGLDKELKGKASDSKNAYPNNLTIGNLADWTFLPTLVYELEYPRQEKINWWYVMEKTAATFGVIGVMQVISQAYIYPPVAETVRMRDDGMSLQQRWMELPWIVSDMLFPLLLEQLLSWYVIWECVLNVFAELTCFADRGFYGDWWNSVSWDQYARDWNRPVHNFLLRHVYHSSISAFHLSRSSATFVTFLLSALVHELIMACLFKKVRGYLLTMQLLQIPLVSLSRTKLLKGRNVLGNVVFWIGLFVGPSVLTSFYLLI